MLPLAWKLNYAVQGQDPQRAEDKIEYLCAKKKLRQL